MAFVWAHGANVLMASCLKAPQPHPRSARQLEILVTKCNSYDAVFELEARIGVPVTGTGHVKLLAAGYVVDSETGLYESFLVYEQSSSLRIGWLDLDDQRLEPVAEMRMPLDGSSEGPRTPIDDCWLANGPTVFALCQGRLMTASYKAPDILTEIYTTESVSRMEPGQHLEEADYTWESHWLDLSDGSQQKQVKVHFCGEIKTGPVPEGILSVETLKDDLDSDRHLPSWVYLSVTANAVETCRGISLGISESEQGMEEALKVSLSPHVPADLDPNMISCIQTVAPAPSSSADVARDVIIGTRDRRLLACRHGDVLKESYLGGIPTQIHFAVVAGGQGVIVILLNDAEQNVVAICAESHQKLQDWSGVWQVVIDDFTLSGHDQIVLLRGSAKSLAHCEISSPVAQYGLDFTVIHGFSDFKCPGTPQGSHQHLKEVKAIDDHKVSGLEAMAKALQERLEAGLAELKLVENEVESKRELYGVASRLLEDVVARHALEKAPRPAIDTSIEMEATTTSKKEKWKMVVEARKIEHRICGTTWFLLLDVEIVEARVGTSLRNVSLHATSLNGCLSGRSSVLSSLSHGEGSRCLVMSIPLRTLSLLPGFPFHIFLKATHVSYGPSEAGKREDAEICTNVFTQWLCCFPVIHPTSVKSLQATEASTIIERAYNQRQFLVAAQSRESVLQWAGRMQSAFAMQDCHWQQQAKSLGNFNLISVSGIGIVHVHLSCIGKHAIITLKASDAHLLVMIQESSLQLFRQHQLQLIPKICYPETVTKAKMLGDAILEELRFVVLMKQGNEDERMMHEGQESETQSLFESSKIHRLQTISDILCSELALESI